jgi:hypothetical protein
MPLDPGAGDAESFPVVSAAIVPPVRRRRVLVTVVAIVVLVAVALAVRADLDVRRDAHHARSEATRDAKRRAALVRDLDRAEVSLAATRAQLATDERVLASATGDRDALNRALGVATTDLAGVRASVNGAQLQLLAGNGQIQNLGQCLNGVQNALNAAAVADTGSAVRALAAVADSCKQAGA